MTRGTDRRNIILIERTREWRMKKKRSHFRGTSPSLRTLDTTGPASLGAGPGTFEAAVLRRC
jgi:hypothetical protein